MNRLKALVDVLQVSISQFEKDINVGASTVNKIILRDAEVSRGISKKILDKYPNISREWLENGKGDMLIDKNLKVDERPNRKSEVTALGKNPNNRLTAEQFEDAFPDWEGLPFYNTPVTASFVETYRDEQAFTPQFFVRDPRFKDCDFAAIVTGDSMHSEIRHGDYIVCKEITDRRFIVYGDIYYIIATNGLETCKYINADNEDRNNLMLIAKNEHISPAPLPKDMILKLYKVKGILRGY